MALAWIGAAALRLISPGESLARAPWPSSLTVHVAKGVRLAVAEAAERDGAAAGVAVAARLSRLIVNELLVYPARMVPFAIWPPTPQLLGGGSRSAVGPQRRACTRPLLLGAPRARSGATAARSGTRGRASLRLAPHRELAES